MRDLAGPEQGPAVIFIAGSGRSGSTLVERAIGGAPACVNVGEVMDLFRRDTAQRERCGCGSTVGQCPFWRAVGERAFGGWEAEAASEVTRLQGRVARQRHLPKLLASGRLWRVFGSDVQRYAQGFGRLYQAISAESSAQYVVDASKWPVQALALFRGGLDVRVIHLVRDPRGVAFSLAKSVPRAQAAEPGETMWRNSYAGAALRWDAFQGECEVLASCGVPVSRMLYEDFVRDPGEAVSQALAGLGVGVRGFDHIRHQTVELGPSHGISGNPSRFKTGPITMKLDEKWRAEMPPFQRGMVALLTAPLAHRYRPKVAIAEMAADESLSNGRGVAHEIS